MAGGKQDKRKTGREKRKSYTSCLCPKQQIMQKSVVVIAPVVSAYRYNIASGQRQTWYRLTWLLSAAERAAVYGRAHVVNTALY